MICRVCGHRNPYSRGRCANCGYDLEYQTLPLEEQRKSLRKRLDKPVSFEERMPMMVHGRSKAGYIGALLALIGIGIAGYILVNHERAVLEATPPPDLLAIQQRQDQVRDSLPLQIGSDIVYVMADDGSSAVPRTNLDLQLIPEGSTAAVLCHRPLPYKPLVVFVERKLLEFKGIVDMEQLCCWTDSTESDLVSIPLVAPPPEGDTIPQPVVLKFIMMENWMVGRVEELNIDVTAPRISVFDRARFDSLLYQVDRRLASRNTEGRDVHVWAMFPEESTVEDIVDILIETAPEFEELGYLPFRLKYFRED